MEQQKEQGNKPKKKAQEPELLDESYMEKADRKRPPYLFIALILFVVLSFAWKGFMSERKAEAPQVEAAKIEQGAK